MSAVHAPEPSCEQIWIKIVASFREACILRKQGRIDQARAILQRDLPPMIAAWSQTSPAEVGQKKRDLEAMFKAEEKKMDEAWLVQRLVTARLTEEIVPTLRTELSQQVERMVGERISSLPQADAPARRPRSPLNRPVPQAPKDSTGHRPVPLRAASPAPQASRRVPLNDIPGMIDAVLESTKREDRRAAPQLAQSHS